MKNRKRNNLGQFAKGSKSEVSFVNLSTYTSPLVLEIANQDWIEYGEDNNYFQFLRILFLNMLLEIPLNNHF